MFLFVPPAQIETFFVIVANKCIAPTIPYIRLECINIKMHPLILIKLYKFIIAGMRGCIYLNLTKSPLYFIRKGNNQNQHNKENNNA